MNVKEARKAVGLTQQGLSNWLGIPKRTIEDWDAGKSNPRGWEERLLVEKIFSYKGDDKVRVFEVVSIKGNDEFQSYIGNDFDEAMNAYNDEVLRYSKLSEHDKNLTRIEPRVYAIDDTVDTSDSDELNNALIDCIGYNFFADEIK